MSYQIKLNEVADEEFLNSFVWYELKAKGLGERFITSVKNKLLKIAEHPFRYPVKKDDFRETPLTGFPYSIVYFIDEIKKNIVISSIYHSKRNPEKKFRK